MAEVETKPDNFHRPGPELRGPAGTDHGKRNVLLCRRHFRIAGLNDIFDFACRVRIHGMKTEYGAGCVPFLFFLGSKTLVPEKYAVDSVVFKSPFELVYNPTVLRSSPAIHNEAAPICDPDLTLRLKIQRSTPTTRCSNGYCSISTDSIAHSGKDRPPTIGRSLWCLESKDRKIPNEQVCRVRVCSATSIDRPWNHRTIHKNRLPRYCNRSMAEAKFSLRSNWHFSTTYKYST